MKNEIVNELRELHQNAAGAIELISMLVEEQAEIMLSEWAMNLFRIAIEIEIRARILARHHETINEARTDSET